MTSGPLPLGLIADLVSPLTRDGRTDAESLTRLARRIPDTAAGVMTGSPVVGEGLDLAVETRLGLLACLAGVIAPPRVVFFDLTAPDEETVLELLDRAETALAASPARVCYVLTPLVYRGNRDLPGHLVALSRLTARPLLLRNDPILAGRMRSRLRHRNIRTAVLKKAAEVPSLAGLIHLGDLGRVLDYHRAVRHRADFPVYDGEEVDFLARPSRAGAVSLGMQVLPAAWSEITAASLSRQAPLRPGPDQVARLWDLGGRVRAVSDYCRPNPAARLKKLLAGLGAIDADVTALPSPEPDGEAPGDVLAAIRELEA